MGNPERKYLAAHRTSFHGNHAFSLKELAKKAINTPVVFLLAIVWVFFICYSKAFLTPDNMMTLLVVNAYFAIAAVGETYVLMTGGIDLSIAQVTAVSSVASASVMVSMQTRIANQIFNAGGEMVKLSDFSRRMNINSSQLNEALAPYMGKIVVVGILTAVGIGIAFGLFNGIFIGFFNMTPFIITLATQLVARGLALVWSNEGRSIGNIPPVVTKMSTSYGIPIGDFMVIPWIVILMLALIVIFGIFLGKTNWGRYITLTGANAKAAEYTGMPVKLATASVYMVSGTLGGIAGFAALMCLGAGDPKIGDTLLLSVIGSVILGGVDMNGGEGSMPKAALGILLFATLINGMTFMNLSLSSQQIVQGIIITVGTAMLAFINKKKNMK